MSEAEARAWRIAGEANRRRLEPREALRLAGLPVVGEPSWAEVVSRIAAQLGRD